MAGENKMVTRDAQFLSFREVRIGEADKIGRKANFIDIKPLLKGKEEIT